MGVLYKAEDTRLGRIVALKLLPERLAGDPMAARRFLREAQAASRISHPNVCTVFDVGKVDSDTQFIAMAYIEGVTLRDLIGDNTSRRRMMPAAEAVAIARQIAAALQAAHARGIIHRDIKSENVMRDQTGHVTVMDFGLALVGHEGRLTRTSTLMGTIAYMAPEVIQGDEPDAVSDLYSLGVVLYEMLAGRLPFRGMHEAAMMYAIISETPTPLIDLRDDLPRWLIQVVERSLEKDRSRRFQSAEEFHTALLGLAGDSVSKGPEIDDKPSVRLPSPPPSPSGETARSIELRLYLSGLSELREEREYLMKRLLPELRILARDRGVILSFVDTSSELQGADGEIGSFLRISLEEIDRCRPYFVGILGNQPGPTLELTELSGQSDFLARHPWIEDALLEGAGLIELEFRHGVLNELRAGRSSRGIFYLRSARSAPDLSTLPRSERERLMALRQEIRRSGAVVREFIGPGGLGEMLTEDLLEIIEQDVADAGRPTTLLDLERRRHDAFARSRRTPYVPNRALVASLNAYVEEGGSPLVLAGPSGIGKSALVSYWAERCRRRHPEWFVLEHYVGVAGGVDHESVLRHLLADIRERHGRNNDIPATREEMARLLSDWLGIAADHPTIIMIDGLDHLSMVDASFDWLPVNLPASLRVIVTVTEGSPAEAALDQQYRRLPIAPLRQEESRAVVERFLAERHDRLPKEIVDRIALHQLSSLPLFLRTVLEEVTLLPDASRREGAVDRYLGVADVAELFQRILERLEDDFGTRNVRDAMSFIWGARSGLSQEELAAVADIPLSTQTALLAGLDYHLVNRVGGSTFSHDHLRSAVEERYLPSDERRRDVHARLARSFAAIVDAGLADEKGNASPGSALFARASSELLHQLMSGAPPQELAERLASIPFFISLFHGETRYLVLSAWRHLGTAIDIEGAYETSLASWMRESRSVDDQIDLLEKLCMLFDIVGRIDASLRASERLLDLARESADTQRMAEAEVKIGWLNHIRGERDAAMEHTTRAYALAESINDRRVMANATGNMGVLHRMRGEYAEALACYARQFEEADLLGDPLMRCNAVGNMGAAYLHSGDLDRALECITRQRSIARELNDRQSLSMAIGNLGIIHMRREDLDRALEAFDEQLAIDEDLGDRKGIAITLDNIGAIHDRRGDYEKGVEYHERSRQMAREIGYSRIFYTATGNMGVSMSMLKDYTRALALLHEALEGHRRIGDREQPATWLLEAATILAHLATDPSRRTMPSCLAPYLEISSGDDWRPAALRKAEEYTRESIAIGEEVGYGEGIDEARKLLLRILEEI